VVHYRGGEPRLAVAALRLSLSLGEAQEWKACAWLMLALASERAGDRAEALRWRRKAAQWYEKARPDRAQWQEVVIRPGGWELGAQIEHLLEEARSALPPDS
jgi:hypothetical protein